MGFTNGRRQAYHVCLKDRDIYALGAIWQPPEHSSTDNACAILTIEANELVRPLHNRMPLIVEPQNHDVWLNCQTPLDAINALLKPYPADRMTATPVGDWVNNVKNEGPKCLEPAVPERTLFD